jgi:hypothetical protein
MENKKTLVWYMVGSLVVGLLIGFWGGSAWGTQAGKMDLMPLVNFAFPKPSDDVRSFTGTVKAVVGATISLEINAPDDYLPHLDNSPRATETRYANTTPDTKFISISNGSVTGKTFSLSDLKTGDIVTVRSSENIRNAQRFDVSEVDLVK